MDLKMKELIAVGAATTANCVPCLKYHAAQAAGAGATVEEITQAVEIGRKVRAGAAKIWDEEAEAILSAASSSARERDRLV